jgi:leader peptidase (prepilin peptidase)/N-methyltransferase
MWRWQPAFFFTRSRVIDPAYPLWFVVAFAALLGSMIGSFLNVCILRWGAEPKQSVVSPRSRCPQCGKGLAWYDNIPVVSWLLLRARCRGCGQPISVQYPLIELATAGIWAYMAYRHGATLDALRGAVFGTILLGIAMTDARAYLIPDEFTWGGLVIGLLFSLAGGLAGLGHALLGAAVGFGILWLVGTVGTWIFKEDAMGGGDVKMMAMVGAFVGWQGVLLTIFLGALIGSLVFVPLMLMGQKKLVPFGIFLAIGAAVTYELGVAIIGWYRGYLIGA